MSDFVSQGALLILTLFVFLVAVGVAADLLQLKSIVALADPLQVGSPIPDFRAVDLQRDAPVGSELFSGRASLVLFVIPGCVACQKLVAELAALRDHNLERPSQFIAVCSADRSKCETLRESLPSRVPVLLDDRGELRKIFRVGTTPVILTTDVSGVRGYHRPKDLRDVLDVWNTIDESADNFSERVPA